jgi:serine phosphatase RsbU (regulator of sigma subunit)
MVTGDCTGHGVPGAFMSLINISILNEIISEREVLRPDLILNEARTNIIKALNTDTNTESKDGMDCVLCCFDLKSRVLEYASANNHFYIIRGKELITCHADKMHVGMGLRKDPFTYSKIQLKENDIVYTFTDGYADQFGGPKGKKFKSRQLEELLLSIAGLPLQEQKEILNNSFNEWKGALDQVDDVLVIAVKV